MEAKTSTLDFSAQEEQALYLLLAMVLIIILAILCLVVFLCYADHWKYRASLVKWFGEACGNTTCDACCVCCKLQPPEDDSYLTQDGDASDSCRFKH